MVHFKDYDFHLLDDCSHVCSDCLNYRDFKDKCWYFWENKKECSQKFIKQDMREKK